MAEEVVVVGRREMRDGWLEWVHGEHFSAGKLVHKIDF